MRAWPTWQQVVDRDAAHVHAHVAGLERRRILQSHATACCRCAGSWAGWRSPCGAWRRGACADAARAATIDQYSGPSHVPADIACEAGAAPQRPRDAPPTLAASPSLLARPRCWRWSAGARRWPTTDATSTQLHHAASAPRRCERPTSTSPASRRTADALPQGRDPDRAGRDGRGDRRCSAARRRTIPSCPSRYNNLAVLYAAQSEFDKARAALEMAIRTNPSYATAHENLGDVYAMLAAQPYSRALQLDPGNTEPAAASSRWSASCARRPQAGRSRPARRPPAAQTAPMPASDVDLETSDATTRSPRPAGRRRRLLAAPRCRALAQKVKLATSAGDIVVELDAGQGAEDGRQLPAVRQGQHYDGTVFHRVIDNFMIQGGGMTPT